MDRVTYAGPGLIRSSWDAEEQIITEFLRGAASKALQNLKLSQQDCTAYDYLRILQDMFGQTAKTLNRIYQFDLTFQRIGEKLFKYTKHLDKILYQLLLKKV